MKLTLKKLSFVQKVIGLNLIVVAGIISVSAFQFNGLVKRLEVRQQEFLVDATENISSTLGDEFYERYGDVQAFASNKIILGDKNEAAAQLNDYAKLYGIYEAIAFYGLDGKLIVSNTKGPDGKPIAVEKLMGASVSSEKWFKDVVNNTTLDDPKKGFQGTAFNGPEFSSLISEVLGRPAYVTVFASAVKDAKGRTVGVMANYADFSWAESTLPRYFEHFEEKEMNGVGFYLINKEGQVISKFVPAEQEGKKNFVRDPNFLLKKNFLEEKNPAALAIAAGQDGYAEIKEASAPVYLSGYRPVNSEKFIDSLGWGAIAKIDKQQAMGALEAEINKFWITLGVLSVLSLVLTYWVASRMGNSLKAVTTSISGVVHQTSSLGNVLSGASGNLASSTQEQAAAIQESVSALSEMSSMIAQTGQYVQHSLKSAEEAKQEADEGKKTLDLLTNSIQSIQKANEQMQEISAIIGNIGEKTSVINDIVFKTQLLSFNASIEAARAGVHGKGFSVVAEEVSSLADLSGEAAKQIEGLLHESQEKVKSTLQQIQVRVTDTVKSNKMVHESFEGINQLVTKIDEQLKSIGEASKQQELGIQQTNTAMRQLEAAAEDNRNSSEKTHRASEELSRESTKLNEGIETLSTFVVGQNKKIENQKMPDKKATTTPAASGSGGNVNELVGKVLAMRPSESASEKSQESKNDKDNFFNRAA